MIAKVGGSIFFLILIVCFSSAQEIDLNKNAIERGQQYERYFLEASAKYGVDPRVLWVVGYLESRFNPKLVSPKGARGLMQLMPATAKRLGVADPHDPIETIDAATRYVRYLLKRFDGRVDLTLAAYNAGEETVEAYQRGYSVKVSDKVINPSRRITGGIPPYRETQNYVIAGLSILKRLSSRLTTNQAIVFGSESPPDNPSRKSIFYIVQPDSAESRESPKSLGSKSALRRSITLAATVELL